jgi:hypothetical protein
MATFNIAFGLLRAAVAAQRATARAEAAWREGAGGKGEREEEARKRKKERREVARVVREEAEARACGGVFSHVKLGLEDIRRCPRAILLHLQQNIFSPAVALQL